MAMSGLVACHGDLLFVSESKRLSRTDAGWDRGKIGERGTRVKWFAYGVDQRGRGCQSPADAGVADPGGGATKASGLRDVVHPRYFAATAFCASMISATCACSGSDDTFSSTFPLTFSLVNRARSV